MPADYTVVRVGEDPGSFQAHGKTLISYWLAVNDGHEEHWVNTRRLETTAPPQSGDVIYGDLIDTPKKDGTGSYKVLKTAQRPDGSPSTNGNSGSASHSRNGDERGARIERQHSQEMALRFLAIHGHPEAITLWDLKGAVKDLTDHFCEDLNNASIPSNNPNPPPGASGGSGPDQPSQSTADPSRLTAIASNLEDKQVRLALIAAGAVDVTDIPTAIAALDPKQAATFKANLEDLGTQADEGVQHPVAVGANDDSDIPF